MHCRAGYDEHFMGVRAGLLAFSECMSDDGCIRMDQRVYMLEAVNIKPSGYEDSSSMYLGLQDECIITIL